MKTVADVLIWLDRFAPPHLAESWDNVGLLWGDPGALVERVMTCLTVTPQTADEAIESGAGLIVSHHPVLFKPVKHVRVRGDDPQGTFLWKLAGAGVAIASPHTAFDNTAGGINDGLARRLGLIDVGPLRPGVPRLEFKVIVFTPESDREAVLAAAFAAGGGQIGNYRECSFGVEGTGTFFGEEAANPAIGEVGRRESVREWRLEIVTPRETLPRVLAAVRRAHSYEEPAIDVVQLHALPAGPGIGRVGRLPASETLQGLAGRVARVLNAPGLQFVGDPARSVERVAIVCGAGDDFVREVRLRADVLLTGEARYHNAVLAEALGLGLIAAGHHATERPGVEDLAEAIAKHFTDLLVWPSRTEKDPLRSLL
jgi:dinuclear metal center YbgI/SA1388 family protein